MRNYLKTAVLGLAFCGPAAFAQQPTITEERSGSGTAVADSRDTEMDAGVPWAVAGIATVAGIVALSWAYMRYKDEQRHSHDSSKVPLNDTP